MGKGKTINFIIILVSLTGMFIADSPCCAFDFKGSIKDCLISPSLQTKIIGVIDFIPLPRNYPPQYYPLELSLTKELFEHETKKLRVFVPRNHVQIVTDILRTTMESKGVSVIRYTDDTDISQGEADILLSGAIKECKVTAALEDDKTLKAEIVLAVSVINGKERKLLLEKSVSDEAAMHDDESFFVSEIFKEGSDILTISEDHVLHPLRILIAAAVHNGAVQILENIHNILLK